MLRPFRVLQPERVSEASRELQTHGEAATLYAGGSELLILLRHGLVNYDCLIDLKHISELRGLSWANGSLRIGANVTHGELERSPLVREHMPRFGDLEAQVANVRVRNVGTLGGNLCFSDPHSDPGTLLLLHDSVVELQRNDERRRLPLDSFFVNSYETALAPDEILVSVEIPELPRDAGVAYQRIEKIERPSLGVAVAASLNDGMLSDVRLAVGCVGPRPMRLRALEAAVEGLSLAEAQRRLREARAEVESALEPVDDIHGSADYKTYLVTVLLARCLAQAVNPAVKTVADLNGGRVDD